MSDGIVIINIKSGTEIEITSNLYATFKDGELNIMYNNNGYRTHILSMSQDKIVNYKIKINTIERCVYIGDLDNIHNEYLIGSEY
jgi:hypothetical protein